MVSHHLDKRAAELAAAGTGSSDDLLTTKAVAEWLGVSCQFLEIARSRGHGPRFLRVSPSRIRYRRDDVLRWLEERAHRSTAEYADDGDSSPE